MQTHNYKEVDMSQLEKKRLRKKIENDTLAYLKRGGVINKVPPGVTGEVFEPIILNIKRTYMERL